MGTTVTMFRERLNQYKLNVNLYSKRVLGLMQEKVISYFFDFAHNVSVDDMHVQMIEYSDPNDEEGRESFWIETP